MAIQFSEAFAVLASLTASRRHRAARRRMSSVPTTFPQVPALVAAQWRASQPANEVQLRRAMPAAIFNNPTGGYGTSCDEKVTVVAIRLANNQP
jgi:hypothetical protein